MVLERKLLNVKDVAVYLGTTTGAVYQMVSRRQIPFVKLRRSTRFDVAAINEFIKQQSVKPLNLETISRGLGG